MICKILLAGPPPKKLTEREVNYLVRTFQEKSFSREYLTNVFSDPRVQLISRAITTNVAGQGISANYQRFLEPVALDAAKKFAGKWRSSLNRAGSTFGVDNEIITAILLVETNLGTYLGKIPVVSMFASIILENHPQRLKEIGRELADNPKKNDYLKRLKKKGKWAKQELKALLAMKKEGGIEILDLKGSYAGAFGIPQFLPSSYLKWGYDGDRDNKVDLFVMSDAIASVVNYLKAHGWKRGASLKTNKKVLWHYNHSNTYVETVLQIAENLRNSANDTPKNR